MKKWSGTFPAGGNNELLIVGIYLTNIGALWQAVSILCNMLVLLFT